MILNVSHLTLSGRDVIRCATALEASGFSAKFVEPSLPNAEEKRPFLREYNVLHALCLCQAAAGIPIEVTDHFGAVHGRGSSYRVLFNRRLAGSRDLPDCDREKEDSEVAEIWAQILGEPIRPALWEPFQSFYWHREEDPAVGPFVQGIGVTVREMARSIRFWQRGIGFRLVDQGSRKGRGWARLAFSTPVSAEPLQLILTEAPMKSENHYRMDDGGFPCLAFLVLELEWVAQCLLQEGACSCSGSFDLQVGGRAIQGKLLRGPDGELIELIELQRVEARHEADR